MSTSGRKKSAYHHGDLRAVILRGGGKLIEEQGVAKVSLREVARRAGVSHNAPYRHFADREALLAALAAEGFSILGKALKESAGLELGAAYVRFARAQPQRFRLMFGGLLPMKKYPALGEAASGAYQVLEASFRGRSEVKEPGVAAAAAWSLVHGLSHLILDGQFPQARSDADGFVKQVLGAVRFAAGAQRPA